MDTIRQWDICLARLDPTHWSEQQWTRPVVVISWNALNEEAPIVIVVPLTTKIKGYFWSLIIEPTEKNGLIQTSEAMCSHVRSISKERLKKRLWSLEEEQIKIVHRKLHLLITTNE